MALLMQVAYTNAGTAGTYTFDHNPTGYHHVETAFKQDNRTTDASLVSFLVGKKSIFTLRFDFIGTAQYAQLGTIFRTQDRLVFWPNDEHRGTNGSYAVRWVNDFNFEHLGAWDMGYRGQIVFEEI